MKTTDSVMREKLKDLLKCGAEIEMKHRVYIGDGWEYCSKCKKLLKYLTKEEVDKWGNPPTETVSDKKIILDLCGGTGSWAKPYKDAGYDVRLVTIPENDVRTYKLPDEPIYGILAAPPCTMFSDARTNAKTPRDLRGGMEVVQACLNLIYEAQYRTQSDQQKYPPLKFWALENPWYGRLKWFLGKPNFVFSPWEFGDAYKKKTAIWGYFNDPIKTVTDMTQVLTQEQIDKHKTNSQVLPKFDYMKSKDIHPEMFGKLSRQARRSITPQGFAKAFMEANL